MQMPMHVASIETNHYVFLRKRENAQFQWVKIDFNLGKEIALDNLYPTVSSAIAHGYKTWFPFRLVHCGFVYTLPERDEVGVNALFPQMVLSYNSFNGRYFDEELGHVCYVDFASQEALEIWRKIQQLSHSVDTSV